MPISNWDQYFDEREEAHLGELFEFLRIPSVSALPAHSGEMRRAAEWVAARLSRAGVPEVGMLDTGGQPLVYGGWQVGASLPTALIYAHYDVQPPDPLDLWETPPFEPSIRDGRIYARGAGDDKAGLLSTILAVEALADRDGAPPLNLVFFFEGEEEIGSPSVAPFVARERERFACDWVISADGIMFGVDQPSLTVSLKGLVGCQVDLTTASTDMHSGIYGGAVRNAAQAIAELAASFHDEYGRVAIEGFYERVKDLSEAERAEIRAVPFQDDEFLGTVEALMSWGEPGYTSLERLWARPTVDINGIWSGFQGEGNKTVTPSQGHLKITCRLVPDQDAGEILGLIERHVAEHCPAGASASIRETTGSAQPFAIARDNPALLAAGDVLRDLYDKEPLIVRSGGTIPIAEVFQKHLRAELIFFGFSLETCNAHAPNEWFRLKDFRRATVATGAYLERLASLAPQSP